MSEHRPAPNIQVRERRVASNLDHDFFRTPVVATRALMAREEFSGTVWEPACGDGAMSRVLEERQEVFSSDLIDRGFGLVGRDFLMENTLPAGCGAIVTNPPFKLATRFAQHAINLGAPKVAFLCRVAFLEGQERAAGIFAGGQLSRVWVFSKRITLWNGADENPRETGGAMAFAWFVWDRAATGTSVGWIT